jgi:hypothetical protein
MISIIVLLIIIICITILPYQAGTAKEIIGTQRQFDSLQLQRIIIKCLGDALLPETVCTNIGSLPENIIKCLGNALFPKNVCAGTDKNDTIVATPQAGIIYGLRGDDKIKGLFGSEASFGNEGNDAIQAGNGSSSIFGNEGNDTLVGGGPNSLFGNISTFLYGGNGDDHLVGRFDYDIMSGGPGHDFFTCTGKQDIIIDFKSGQDNFTGNCLIL